MADRKTPAPSNASGPFDGTAFMEDVNDEVSNLWRRASCRLNAVAGTNVITGAADVPLLVNQAGNQFWFTPAAPNTGNVTLNIDGRGALPLRDASGAELPAGYLSASRIETVINLGTEFRCTMPNLSGAAGSALLRAVLTYQKANNVDGGTATAGSRQRYPFNTVVSNTIPGLTLDTVTNIGRMSLPARSYERVEARCQFFGIYAGIYLHNVSDSADLTPAWRHSMGDRGVAAVVARPVLAATKNIEVQYYCAAGQIGNGLGVAVDDSSGAVEQYGFIEITSYG